MISRKITFRADLSKIDQLISLLEEENPQNEDLITKSILASDSLTPYFYNLHHLITRQNLLLVRRYEVLNDGLYILLKGQVSFMSCEYAEKNMRITKGSCVNKNSITAVLSSPLCVFESTSKNCTTLQESYLLKVTEEQIMASRFLEMFGRRAELYEKHYLACDHQALYNTEEINDILSTDLKIHSNFFFKKYTFRQIIVLNTAAIIASGRVRLKMHSHTSHEMDRFGLLLPFLTYQVASSELSIMIVLNNQTLNFKIDIQTPVRDERSLKLSSHKTACNSVIELEPLKEAKLYDNIHFKKEKEKREKQIVKLTKQSENYSIISSFLCQKSLEFVRKQNLKAKTKEKKQNRYKNPLILFNIVNEKSKLAIPSFTDTTNTPCSSRVNTKYINQFNLTPDTFQSNNKSILRKIKLPPSDYDKIVKKHQRKQSDFINRKQTKNNTVFTLNIGHHLNDSRQELDGSFRRYCKAE